MFVVFKSREYLFSPFAVYPEEALTSIGAWLAGVAGKGHWLNVVAVFALAFTNGFYIARIVSRNMIYIDRTYMPALIYLMVSLGYYWSPVSTVTLLVSFLLIFALENIIHSYRQQGRIGFFFNASIAVGIASVIYAPAVVFFAMVIACLVYMRRMWRDWVVAFGGFLIPIFLYSYVHWGMGDDFLYIPQSIYGILTTTIFVPAAMAEAAGPWEYIMAGAVIAALVLSLVTSFRRRGKMRKRSSVAYNIFIYMLVFTLLMFALPCRSLVMMPIAAIPLAAVIPGYFNHKTGIVPNLLYLLLMLSILLYNLAPVIKTV